MKLSYTLTLFLLLFVVGGSLSAQFTIKGYVFEQGNRGFLNECIIEVVDAATEAHITTEKSNLNGEFVVDVPPGVSDVVLKITKDSFHEKHVTASAKDAKAGKMFLKVEMKREPGYIFEITLAEKKDSLGNPTDAISGALIEVYNNTTRKPVLVLEDYKHPDFKVTLKKGNHYTVMVRKRGYLVKRMEAFVNVNGCILCFEGIGEVRPGVSDNLTEGNEMGTLLANVELEPVYEGKKIEVQNIYYDYGSAKLTTEAKSRLDELAVFLNDNPNIRVELGSHTDARGKSNKNLSLSNKRAQAAVGYLINEAEVPNANIVARGYGESFPTNKCKDGVDCTEQQHAANRRTEIKIIGLVAMDMVHLRSLEQLKIDENFDSILEELQSEGEIKVNPEDGEMPDALKAQLEKQGGIPTGHGAPSHDAPSHSGNMNAEMPTKDAPVKVIKEEVEETISEDITPEIKKTKTKVEKSMGAATHGTKHVDTEVVEQVRETSTGHNQESVDVAEHVTDAVVGTAAAKPAMEVTEKVVEEVTATTKKEVVSKDVQPLKITSDFGDYTGHKIAVLFSEAEMHTDSDEVKNIGVSDIYEYKGRAGYYLYLIGDYKSKESAEKALNSQYIERYPYAYVVGFKDGERTN